MFKMVDFKLKLFQMTQKMRTLCAAVGDFSSFCSQWRWKNTSLSPKPLERMKLLFFLLPGGI